MISSAPKTSCKKRWSRWPSAGPDYAPANPTAYARTIIARDHISWWRRQRREVLTDIADAAVPPSAPEERLVVLRAQRAVADLPHLDRGAEALRRARVVRRRRAVGGLAAFAAAAAVAIAVPQVVSGPDRVPTPAPSPTITPTVEPTLVPPAPIKASDFPKWDPFTLPDLPRGESVLPELLDPPDQATSVLEDPIPAAVVAWPEEGRDLMLLAADGSWRSVPDTADAAAGYLYEAVTPVLTADGTQVALSTRDGIVLIDVTVGVRTLHGWPPQIPQPTDTLPLLDWLPGDQQIHVNYWNSQWIVRARDGRIREAPWSSDPMYQTAFDPSGLVRQHRFDHNDLVTWAGDLMVNDVPAVWWGERYVARHGLVAFTGNVLYTGTQAGPAVVDGDTAEVVAWLRVPDRNSEYGDNGYLTVLGFLDPETLVIKVAPMEFGAMEIGEETWYLATWNYETGEIEQLTHGDTRMRTIAVATDVIR